MRLEDLRAELNEVDQDLVRLVARRQTLASEIGQVKRRMGLPTRDYEREKEVIECARRAAETYGVPPEVMEKLQLVLIRSSVMVQERDKLEAHGGGSGKRVLVIGGSGGMGRWFVGFLSSQGYHVEIADPAGPIPGYRHYQSWQEVDLQHDVIVVAAPLGQLNDILLGLADVRPSGLVFDIGSLKSPLKRGITALLETKVRIASIHPMFGPDTDVLSGRHVIFIDVGAPQATAEARQLFYATAATQVDMDLESHDRLIAYVLGLSHALNIVFFTALSDSGETAPRLAQASSTTFDAQLEVAARVAHENPRLYFEIQSLNAYGVEALTSLLRAIERLLSIVQNRDQLAFAELMERGLAYLSGRGDWRQGASR